MRPGFPSQTGSAAGRSALLRGCLAILWALTGCTPAFDWREFRPEGVPLSLMFPCKPDGHARMLALADAPVKWTLHACQAGEVTWGLAWADVSDPARVGPALLALRDSSQANLGAPEATARPLKVTGATPQPASGRWAMTGRAPNGRMAHGEVAVFAKGTVVFQATALSFTSAPGSAEAFETFFAALRFAS